MKKYDGAETCIKCGHDGIEDVHHTETYLGFYVGVVPDHAKTPEHIERTCKNCDYSWQETPLDAEDECSFDRFVDSFVKHLSEAKEITEEEILKEFSNNVKTDDPGGIKATCEMATPDNPVLKVGDIVKMSNADNCEHEVLAHPTADWWCLEGYDRTINTAELNKTVLVLKGPKVHTFKEARLISRSLDNGMHHHGYGVVEKLRHEKISIEVTFEGNAEQYKNLPEKFTLKIQENTK